MNTTHFQTREQVCEKFHVLYRTWTLPYLVCVEGFLVVTYSEGRGSRKVCALLFFYNHEKVFTLIILSIIVFNAIHAEITWTLSDDGTLTISGTDMPNYGSGNAPWYSQNDKIKEVEIKYGVTSIGDCAFQYCSFTSITIPNSVTSIGTYAFHDCTSPTSITIPNSVTSIGYCAFGLCRRLTSITIPNSVTSIESEAFYGCSGLTSVTIPNSVTNIGSEAFSDCSALTSITIPNSVTSIGERAFDGCSRLPLLLSQTP